MALGISKSASTELLAFSSETERVIATDISTTQFSKQAYFSLKVKSITERTYKNNKRTCAHAKKLTRVHPNSNMGADRIST